MKTILKILFILFNVWLNKQFILCLTEYKILSLFYFYFFKLGLMSIGAIVWYDWYLPMITLVGYLSIQILFQGKLLDWDCVSTPENVIQPVFIFIKSRVDFIVYRFRACCTDLSIEVQPHQAEMRIGRNRWNSWERIRRRPGEEFYKRTDVMKRAGEEVQLQRWREPQLRAENAVQVYMVLMILSICYCSTPDWIMCLCVKSCFYYPLLET